MTGPAKKSSRALKREQAIGDRLFSMLCKGHPDEDVAATLDLDDDAYAELKARVFQEKATALKGRPSEVVYLEFLIEMRRTLTMTNNAIGKFEQSIANDGKGAGRTGPALVSAIRLRADLLTMLIDKGQSLGVIDKSAGSVQLIGGIAIGGLSESQIRELIDREMDAFKSIAATSVDVLEVQTGPLHYGPSGDPELAAAIPTDGDES